MHNFLSIFTPIKH